MQSGKIAILVLFLALQSTLGVAQTSNDTYPVPEEKLIFAGVGVRGGKLVLALQGNPDSFNPLLNHSAYSAKILHGPVYDALQSLDLTTMELTPQLASQLDVSPDGLTYTYTLRKGVRWSDGKPFTAEDVLFTFGIVFDPKINGNGKDGLMQSDGSSPQIQKIGDNQIQFQLKELNVLFASAISSVYIIPKHIWEEPYKTGKFEQTMLVSENTAKMVSTGPYLIDTYVPDQRVVLKRNPYYYKFDTQGVRLPYLDKVVHVIVPDMQTALIKFQNGETDMHEVKGDEVDLVLREQTDKGYTVHDMGPSYDTNYMVVNQANGQDKTGKPYLEAKKLEVFSDKRFRQALSYAMDRDSLVKIVHHGHGVPIYTFTSPGNKIWYNPNSKTYPFDLNKAKSLLQEMGLKDSNADGILEYKDGTPLVVTLRSSVESSVSTQFANIMKGDFLKIGIEIHIVSIPFNSVQEDIYVNHNFDLALLAWASAVPPDPIISKAVILSSGKSHNWNPNQTTPQTDWEKQMDALVFKNQSTLDLNERIKYWHQILEIWGEELPEIMITARRVNLAIRNHIGNTKPVAIRTYFDWNVDELYDKTLVKTETK